MQTSAANKANYKATFYFSALEVSSFIAYGCTEEQADASAAAHARKHGYDNYTIKTQSN